MASINYNDSRFTELEKDKNAAINQSNSTYDSLINQSQGYYDDLIAQSKENADKQAALQNQQTEFAIDKIEQQKDQAKKDYTKEQKGAYQDYMKQSNAYGSNMQAAGQQGLGGSGWSETIQSGFYNTYQNRYAQARESYNTIVMNYDNNIKEAQLQNSSALLQIYNQAQKEQLELALQNFTVIKDLSIAKQNASVALDSEYNNRWRQVESQINTENALAEEIRQYNATLAEQQRQANMDNSYRQQVLALEREQFNWQKAQSSGGSSGGSGGGSKGSGGGSVNIKGTSGGSGSNGSGSASINGSGGNSSSSSSSSGSGSTPVGATQNASSVKSGGKTWYTLAGSNFKVLGLEGAPSQATIDKKVAAGELQAKVIDGKMYYRKGFSGAVNSVINQFKK